MLEVTIWREVMTSQESKAHVVSFNNIQTRWLLRKREYYHASLQSRLFRILFCFFLVVGLSFFYERINGMYANDVDRSCFSEREHNRRS